MIEVEVGDREGVDARPAVSGSQARQDTRPAVEQEHALALDEVAGLRSTGVGPRGGTADHCELHRHILADFCDLVFRV